jgi:hypothetical protein
MMLEENGATIPAVFAGLVPAISLGDARCPSQRDCLDKPGNDERKGGEALVE